MSHHARTLLVVVAIVASVLATLSAEGGDITLAFAAAHLP